MHHTDRLIPMDKIVADDIILALNVALQECQMDEGGYFKVFQTIQKGFPEETYSLPEEIEEWLKSRKEHADELISKGNGIRIPYEGFQLDEDMAHLILGALVNFDEENVLKEVDEWDLIDRIVRNLYNVHPEVVLQYDKLYEVEKLKENINENRRLKNGQKTSD